MAGDKRITELDNLAAPAQGDHLPVAPAAGGDTKRSTVAQLMAVALLNAAQLVAGSVPLGRLVDLTNAQIATWAAIAWTKISKAGSSLADLATRSAADLNTGILPDARMPNLTGDITTVEGAVATTLATVNTAPGVFGSSTMIPVVTVSAKGLITASSQVAASGGGGGGAAGPMGPPGADGEDGEPGPMGPAGPAGSGSGGGGGISHAQVLARVWLRN